MAILDPTNFIITRKRKLYKFALFNNSSICFEFNQWKKENSTTHNLEIGAGTVGYVDSEISEEFREIFSSHDFIISKGMGNYEGLTEIDLSSKEVFFLLCSKCTTISKDIGVNLHDMLLLKNRN